MNKAILTNRFKYDIYVVFKVGLFDRGLAVRKKWYRKWYSRVWFFRNLLYLKT